MHLARSPLQRCTEIRYDWSKVAHRRSVFRPVDCNGVMSTVSSQVKQISMQRYNLLKPVKASSPEWDQMTIETEPAWQLNPGSDVGNAIVLGKSGITIDSKGKERTAADASGEISLQRLRHVQESSWQNFLRSRLEACESSSIRSGWLQTLRAKGKSYASYNFLMHSLYRDTAP